MGFQRVRCLTVAALLFAGMVGAAAQSGKPVLSVLDLRTKDVSREEMLGVVDGLTAALFDTGSFTVIDRSARDALLGEIEFSLSSAADSESQKKIGMQLAADIVVGGSVSRYDDGKCVLSLRMLETSSAAVLGVSEDLYADFTGMLGALGQQARTLVASVRTAKAKAAVQLVIPAPRPVPSGANAETDVFAPLPQRDFFPFQFSIWAPIQLVPAKTGIVGLRIGFIFSDNVAVTGIDLGLINYVSGLMSGFQSGLIGYAGEARIVQANIILNTAKIVRGSQIGLVNVADKCAGLQIGLVNVAGLLRGMQIGLVNVIRYGEGSRFMPGINLSL